DRAGAGRPRFRDRDARRCRSGLAGALRRYTFGPLTRGRCSWRPAQAPEEVPSVQLRVVADQPWDVKADVLAIPIVGEPAFDGPLGELNKRTGGDVAGVAAFGELRAKRFTSAIAAPGEVAAGRVLTVSAGDADKL